MTAFIKLRIKKNFTDKKTFVLILILFVMLIQQLVSMNLKASVMDINTAQMVAERNIKRNLFMLKDDLEKSIDSEVWKTKADNEIMYLEALNEKLLLALKEEDIKEVYRITALVDIFEAKTILSNENFSKSDTEYIKNIFDNLKVDEDFTEFGNYRNFTTGDINAFNYFSTRAEYISKSLEKGQIPMHQFSTNFATAIMVYKDQILSNLLFLIFLILGFGIINDDIESGSIKTLLTGAISRKQYVLGNILSLTITGIIVTAVPILIIGIYYIFKEGLVAFQMPTIYYIKNMSFDILLNNVDIQIKTIETCLHLGFEKVSSIPMGTMGISSGLKLIPMWKAIILAIPIEVLNAIFCSAFIVFIGLLIKQKFLAFLISAFAYYGANMYFSQSLFNSTLNFAPFSLNNATRIINGTFNTTFLIAIISLGLSLIILTGINILIFRKRDL